MPRIALLGQVTGLIAAVLIATETVAVSPPERGHAMAIRAVGRDRIASTRQAARLHILTADGRTHRATLTLIAGYDDALGGFNFDGYGHGHGHMVIRIPLGYLVSVVFRNHGAYPHSLVVTPYAVKDKVDGYPDAFPGSHTPNPSFGFTGPQTQRFFFHAARAGMYAIVCGVPGHETAGMWETLLITRGGTARISLR